MSAFLIDALIGTAAIAVLIACFVAWAYLLGRFLSWAHPYFRVATKGEMVISGIYFSVFAIAGVGVMALAGQTVRTMRTMLK